MKKDFELDNINKSTVKIGKNILTIRRKDQDDLTIMLGRSF